MENQNQLVRLGRNTWAVVQIDLDSVWIVKWTGGHLIGTRTKVAKYNSSHSVTWYAFTRAFDRVPKVDSSDWRSCAEAVRDMRLMHGDD